MGNNTWIKTGLLYLFVVGVAGCILRSMAFTSIPVNYKYLLHAHTHAAFLGWIFFTLSGLLLHAYIPQQSNARNFRIQFLLFNLSNIGMLFSFPLQGYGAISITFSTLHILTSYWFTRSFLSKLRLSAAFHSKLISVLFIRAAFVFLVLSTLAPFALGPVMVSSLRTTPLYNNLVYFYLHFQYNGWLTFSILGLFFWLLEKNRISFPDKIGRYFFVILVSAALPSYALSLLWSKPGNYIFCIALAGAVLQVVAVVLFIRILIPAQQQLKYKLNSFSYFLLCLAIIFFIIKIGLQLLSGFPYFADLFFRVRNFVITYLHLVLIGFVSFFILALSIQTGLMKFSMRFSKIGLWIFILGFLFSESMLLKNSITIWIKSAEMDNYAQWLFGLSILMPLGILFILREQFLKSPSL